MAFVLSLLSVLFESIVCQSFFIVSSKPLRWQYNSGMISADLISNRFDVMVLYLARAFAYCCYSMQTKKMIPIRVTEEDKSNWILDRLERLHTSITITKLLPPAVISDACKFCRFSERCTLTVTSIF